MGWERMGWVRMGWVREQRRGRELELGRERGMGQEYQQKGQLGWGRQAGCFLHRCNKGRWVSWAERDRNGEELTNLLAAGLVPAETVVLAELLLEGSVDGVGADVAVGTGDLLLKSDRSLHVDNTVTTARSVDASGSVERVGLGPVTVGVTGDVGGGHGNAGNTGEEVLVDNLTSDTGVSVDVTLGSDGQDVEGVTRGVGQLDLESACSALSAGSSTGTNGGDVAVEENGNGLGVLRDGGVGRTLRATSTGVTDGSDADLGWVRSGTDLNGQWVGGSKASEGEDG